MDFAGITILGVKKGEATKKMHLKGNFNANLFPRA